MKKRGRPPKDQSTNEAITIQSPIYSPPRDARVTIRTDENSITDEHVRQIETLVCVPAYQWGVIPPKRIIAAVLDAERGRG
jgi:hypothetical protein